jgi:UDPglucose 6-dehydrogenase
MIAVIGTLKQKIMNYDSPIIGIIGLGFVGDAIRSSINIGDVRCVDTDPTKNCFYTYNDLMSCDGIFVCVPSPQNHDGSCSTTILEEVLLNLKTYEGVIISKVTAPPDVYERLQKEYRNLVHIPEFLTAANAREDYRNEDWAIIGGCAGMYQREAERILKYSKSKLDVIYCSIGEAALTKYIINSFLATKVVFMNEMEQLATSQNCNWDKIRSMISRDPRINISHTQVPGPDGYYGFGGMCFPKDTSAILYYAKSLNISLNVLNEAVKKNTLLRLQKPK